MAVTLQKTCPERSGQGMDMPCVGEKCGRWVDARLGEGPTWFRFVGCGMIADRDVLMVEEKEEVPE